MTAIAISTIRILTEFSLVLNRMAPARNKMPYKEYDRHDQQYMYESGSNVAYEAQNPQYN